MTPRAPREPRLELVELSWRMQSLQKATRILECGIYNTETGLEVRVGYSPEDILHTQWCATIEVARDCAEALHQTSLATDGFEDVWPPGDHAA